MDKKPAKLFSDILNPYLVGFLTIIVIAFEATETTPEALKWASIGTGLSILPVFTVVVFLMCRRKLDGLSIRIRQQRYSIYLIASGCAIISCAALFYLGAPLLLRASFVAGLAAIITFMGINLLWKISIHAGFVAASATIMIYLYGTIGAVAAAALLLIGWARLKLEHHSPAQVASGALLAATIVVLVLHLFGLTVPA